jgi:Dolichyl-phosphate-mannose-protein mannosyltransferase
MSLRGVIVRVLSLSLVTAAYAQIVFGMEPLEARDAGIPFALGAIILFSLTVMLADRWLGRAADPTDCPTAPHRMPIAAQSVRRLRTWRKVGVAISIGLCLIVMSRLYADALIPGFAPIEADHIVDLCLWISAVCLFVVSVAVPPARSAWHVTRWWKQNWPLTIAVGGIVLVALIARVYHLGSLPPTLGGDEGSQGVEALKILSGELRNPFVTSWLSVPTLSFFFNTLTIGPLGHTAVALRLPWALIGTATVLVMFALVWRLKGLALGLITAVLLAVYHFHIHYSRLGSNQIADAFFMAAAFLFLYRAYDKGGLFNWAMAGVVAGAAQYFYAGARFTTIMVGVTVGYFIVRERVSFVRAHWRGLITLLGAFLITAGPMLQYALLYPEDYNGRLNMVGVFQSGWLKLAEAEWQQSPLQILLGYQLKRSALAYNAFPDTTFWYGSPLPLFDGLWAILFMLGLGYATLRPFDRRLFPMLIWWWGAILLGGVLTENPPSSQRLITSAPPAVFFAAVAVWKIGQIVERVIRPSSMALVRPRIRRYIVPVMGAVVIAALCVLSLRWYFVQYTPLRIYGNYTANTADGLIRYMQEHELGADRRIIYFGAPEMYVDFGAIKYILNDVEAVDIAEPLTAPPDPAQLSADKQPIFFFMPARNAELKFVQQAYPGGRVEELPSPQPGAPGPMLYVYRVD